MLRKSSCCRNTLKIQNTNPRLSIYNSSTIPKISLSIHIVSAFLPQESKHISFFTIDYDLFKCGGILLFVFKHYGIKGIFPVQYVCEPKNPNSYQQTMHTNGYFLECVFDECEFRSTILVNPFPQMSQINGRKSECKSECSLRWLLSLNIFPHSEQMSLW